MTLCCVREEYGYLRYLVVTCGYLWLPALPGIAWLYAVYEEYGYLRYLVVTCGYYVLPALPGIAWLYAVYERTMVTSVTW